MPTTQEIRKYLRSPVKLKSLIRQLDFDEEDLPSAILKQPSLFLEASRYRVQRMRKRFQAEAIYEKERVEAALAIRRKKRKTKITEAYIKDLVARRLEEPQERIDNARELEEFAKLLLDAYRYRKDACKILSELLGAEATAQGRLVRRGIELRGFKKLKEDVKIGYKKKQKKRRSR